MTKLCLIGNSHLAAIKLAWDDVAQQPHYRHMEMDFFSSPQNSIGELAYSDNRLMPTTPAMKKMLMLTSGGKESIDLAGYDCFLLYGLTLNAKNLYMLLQKHMPFSFNIANGAQCISRHLFSEVVFYRMQSFLAITMARRLTGYTSRPIYSCLAPHPAEKIRHTDTPVWSQIEGEDNFRMMADTLDQGIARTNGHGFTLFRQPDHTVVDSIFTANEFSTDAPRGLYKNFENGYSEDDTLHMNKNYGRALLDHALAVMGIM